MRSLTLQRALWSLPTIGESKSDGGGESKVAGGASPRGGTTGREVLETRRLSVSSIEDTLDSHVHLKTPFSHRQNLVLGMIMTAMMRREQQEQL